jgi:replicative DNA helicase
VIIDYLQEIKEPSERNDNTGSALHRVCQKIRQAAKDCDCAVIGLSQVKREVEQRANKRPMTSDLSGSAAIEAVADTIILLYRDEYYNPDTSDRGVIEVNVAKQRNGPTGLIKMRYDKDYQRITGKGDEQYAVHQESLALV